MDIKERTVYCISKIVPDDIYDMYVGSTSRPLRDRLSIHKCLATLSSNTNNKFYMRMNEVGLDKWEIKPLLILNCDKEQIRKFEKKWLKILEADLNTYSPHRTKNDIRQQQKKFYIEHKEQILQKNRKYYEENKNAIIHKNINYYQNNKDAILQRQKKHHSRCIQEKKYYCTVCDIACESKRDLDRHFKTKKHTNMIEEEDKTKTTEMSFKEYFVSTLTEQEKKLIADLL